MGTEHKKIELTSRKYCIVLYVYKGVVKTSKITFSIPLIVIMGLLHIWNRNLKEKNQISNF